MNTDVDHDPRLYHAARVAAALTSWSAADANLAAYREEGYLAIANAFTAQQVDDARAALAHLVAGGVSEFNNIQFEEHVPAGLAPEQRFDYVRKLMGFVPFEPRLAALAHDPRLLAIVGRLLGAKPQLMQDMALLKPAHGREKPWHQDNAYFDIPPGTPVVGVWIALDDATPDNGCMHLLPGEHRKPVIHFKRRDWQICDTEILGRSCVAVPLAPGGCLIFDGMLPHGTPTNHSNQRRRAVQYHYVPEGTPRIDSAPRLAAFGSEGKDVTC